MHDLLLLSSHITIDRQKFVAALNASYAPFSTWPSKHSGRHFTLPASSPGPEMSAVPLASHPVEVER